jgi:hypothetical protein
VNAQHVPGRNDVALALRHLLPVAVEDQAEAQNILERHFVEQQCADGVKRIEPAARLVNGFADVISGELRLEFIFVLERIVPLRDGHRTRVEPHVNEIGDAAHLLAAFVRNPSGLGPRTGDGDRVR